MTGRQIGCENGRGRNTVRVENVSWPNASEVRAFPPHLSIMNLDADQNKRISGRRVICDFKCHLDCTTGWNAFDVPNRNGWGGRAGANKKD